MEKSDATQIYAEGKETNIGNEHNKKSIDYGDSSEKVIHEQDRNTLHNGDLLCNSNLDESSDEGKDNLEKAQNNVKASSEEISISNRKELELNKSEGINLKSNEETDNFDTLFWPENVNPISNKLDTHVCPECSLEFSKSGNLRIHI